MDISYLSDIELEIKGEVGRKREMFSKVLRLKEGDIIELDKSLEDYINVYLNDQPFAVGEMVVVNKKFGIRIVDLA